MRVNDVNDKKFKQEISSMMKLKHENIVRILGYCADTQSKLWPIDNEKYVMAEDRQRFICFEFVPEGSLDKHISDASRGLDWRTRYHIIKGICMGLHYLHQNKIVHLDLKPANVLLHHYNVPKIADFGLTRCFDEEQIWVQTSNKIGTLGYMAPEYIDKGEITLNSDIYSLGIIITEILTGQKEGNLLVENVLESWSTRFQTSQGGTWLKHVRVCAEISLECRSFEPEKRPTTQHIIRSLEELEYTYGSIETDISAAHWHKSLDILCMVEDQHKRPTIDHIIDMLNDGKEAESETVPPVGNSIKSSESSLEKVSSDSMHLLGTDHGKLHYAEVTSSVSKLVVQSMGFSAEPCQQQRKSSVKIGAAETSTEIRNPRFPENGKPLDIHPVELQFSFEPNKISTCPVSLTNRTRYHVGVWITPIGSCPRFRSCFQCSPSFGIVEPHSTWVVTITMKKQQQPPPSGKDTEFEVLMVVMRSEQELQLLKSPIGSMLNTNTEFLKRVEGSGGMHRAILTPVVSNPTSCPEVASNEINPGSPTRKMLDVHPLELRFSWETNQHRCSLSLTNRTDHYVGVWITPTCLDSCFDFLFPVLKWPQTAETLFPIMKPHSTWIVSVTMKKQPLPPLGDKENKLEVLLVAMASVKNLESLSRSMGNKLNIDGNLLNRVRKLGGEVHRTVLSAVSCDPASQAILNHQMISTNEFGSVYSLDVHPTETWILTGHTRGFVSIWNYHTQERVMALRVCKEPGTFYSFFTRTSAISCVYTAKFIAQNQWFAIGDDGGCINIYNYTTKEKVVGFEAHSGKPINSLAVHPTYPFLLSSSHLDSSIKLWDWDQGWVCTRTFDGLASGVLRITFKPRDINTFASVNTDGTGQVWNIHSSRPITTLARSCSVDFLFNVSHRDMLVTCGLQTDMCAEGHHAYLSCAQIWDLKTKECVHTLLMDMQSICNLACHPTLPIFATMFLDGTLCLWDATTYRLEKMVHLSGCLDRGMQFIETKDFTRLVVGHDKGVAIWKLICNSKDGRALGRKRLAR